MSRGATALADRVSAVMDAGGFPAGSLAFAAIFGTAAIAYAARSLWTQASLAVLRLPPLLDSSPWLGAGLALVLLSLIPLVLLVLATAWLGRYVKSPALFAFVFVGFLIGAGHFIPPASALPAEIRVAYGLIRTGLQYAAIAGVAVLAASFVKRQVRGSRTTA